MLSRAWDSLRDDAPALSELRDRFQLVPFWKNEGLKQNLWTYSSMRISLLFQDQHPLLPLPSEIKACDIPYPTYLLCSRKQMERSGETPPAPLNEIQRVSKGGGEAIAADIRALMGLAVDATLSNQAIEQAWPDLRQTPDILALENTFSEDLAPNTSLPAPTDSQRYPTSCHH